jgi:hypothetical protein
MTWSREHQNVGCLLAIGTAVILAIIAGRLLQRP